MDAFLNEVQPRPAVGIPFNVEVNAVAASMADDPVTERIPGQAAYPTSLASQLRESDQNIEFRAADVGGEISGVFKRQPTLGREPDQGFPEADDERSAGACRFAGAGDAAEA